MLTAIRITAPTQSAAGLSFVISNGTPGRKTTTTTTTQEKQRRGAGRARRTTKRNGFGRACVYASSSSSSSSPPKIVVTSTSTTSSSSSSSSKYEVTEKVKIGPKGNVQLDVRSGRLYAQATEKTATLKVNGNACFPGVAYVIKPEGATCEIGSQGEDEVAIFNVSLENANANAAASADAMSEMLAKSFEMTASKEVQNALKVEKVLAAKKLAIHTKDMDLPPS